MAISGVEIVSQHILDDSQFRTALGANEALARTTANRIGRSLTIETSVARRGLQTLSATTLLLGGSQTFLAIQLGRAALATGQLTASLTSATVRTVLLTSATNAAGASMVAFSKITGITLLGGVAALAAGI